MAANDTIADMLTRIRNSCMARHQTTQIPSTRMTRSIAQVLKLEGFIADFEETGEGIKKILGCFSQVQLQNQGSNYSKITASQPTGFASLSQP